jgi:uncharacterized protein
MGNQSANIDQQMKAAITGATGFIGGRLKQHLESLGWKVISLTRDNLKEDDSVLSSMIEGCDVLINLAGAPIIARHTAANKKEMYESRVNTTLKLVSALIIAHHPPKHFISASAVGIYAGNGPHTETSTDYADDFMANVLINWEQAAMQASPCAAITITRQGVVLDNKQGGLPTMALPFKLGVGGKIASGGQMFSWIHIDDLINAFMHVIEGKKSGIYNFTSPGYLSNADFTKVLANTLNRPALFTVPEVALKLIYGSGSKALISGQAVYPERLLNEGFKFKYPVIEEALKDLLQEK